MTRRIRSVKPEWLDDEKMGSASDEARVLSIALMLMADDHGRGRASISAIASGAWQYQMGRDDGATAPETLAKASRAFRELLAMGFVVQYEVGGQRYYEIRNWTRHQRVDKVGKPQVPAPNPLESHVSGDFPEPFAKPSRESRETLATDLDLEGIRNGGGGGVAAAPPPDPLAAACDPSASRAIDAYRDGIGSVVGKRPPVNHASRFGQASELWASLDGTDAERLDAIRRAAAVAARDDEHRKANVPFAWFARNVGKYSTQAETPDTEAIRAKLRKLTEDVHAARMRFDHDLGDKLQAEANALRRQIAGAA